MFNFHPAARRQRKFILRNLVAFGEVGIEIVFARETRMIMYGTIQRQRGANPHFDRSFVEHRQGTRKSEADRAGIRVGLVTEARGTTAEYLRPGQQLGVDFQPDHRLIFGEELGSDAGFCSELGHSLC